MNPQQQAEVQALLDQLSDVVAPAQPGWWPPAIGWWGVLALACSLLCLLGFALTRQRKAKRKNLWRRQALRDHKRLKEQSLAKTEPPRESVLAELSVLMRRVALAVQPRDQIASLTDDQWLDMLDVIGDTNEYSSGVGQLLYRTQYKRMQQTPQQDLSRLFDLTESTIRKAQQPQVSAISEEVSGAAL